jgi:hypothetical protein
MTYEQLSKISLPTLSAPVCAPEQPIIIIIIIIIIISLTAF